MQKNITEKEKELEKIKQEENKDIDKYFGGMELLSEPSKNEPEISKNKKFDDELF